jgi:hypothetical protein
MGGHERGVRKGKFCCAAKKKNCGDCPVTDSDDKGKKNYIAICDPGWKNYTFPQYVARKRKPYVYPEKYEAHHILCVASVTECILGMPGIQGAVRKTQWCINNKPNMIALPLLGHVVKYYCDIDDSDNFTAIKRQVPPPFNGVPCHDVSHDLYQEEVEQALMQIACNVKDQDHDVQADSLREDLVSHSEHFGEELKARGMRKGGVHEGWRLAHRKRPGPDPEWNHPFSMAHDAATSYITMPTIDEKKQEWISRISKAIASGLA